MSLLLTQGYIFFSFFFLFFPFFLVRVFTHEPESPVTLHENITFRTWHFKLLESNTRRGASTMPFKLGCRVYKRLTISRVWPGYVCHPTPRLRIDPIIRRDRRSQRCQTFVFLVIILEILQVATLSPSKSWVTSNFSSYLRNNFLKKIFPRFLLSITINTQIYRLDWIGWFKFIINPGIYRNE